MTQTPDLLMETPFFNDAAPGPSGIDVLSDILRVFHVTGAALLRGEFDTATSHLEVAIAGLTEVDTDIDESCDRYALVTAAT